MFGHLSAHQIALPPPRRARTERFALWLAIHRADPATAHVGTLVVVALAIVSALTLLATTSALFAVPTTMLVVGAALVGSVAVRSRAGHARHAPVSVTRPRAAEQVSELRGPRVRSARKDRTMLLQAGRGES